MFFPALPSGCALCQLLGVIRLELAFKYFPRRNARQLLVPEEHMLGNLERGQVLGQVIPQLRLGKLTSGLQHNGRTHRFAQSFVG